MPLPGEKSVRAIAKGYHIGPREVGEVFTIAEGATSKWFVDVEPKAKAKPKAEQKPAGGASDDDLA